MGRNNSFPGLRFFRYVGFQWLLRKHVLKIGHYLETRFSEKIIEKFWVVEISAKKKYFWSIIFFQVVYMKRAWGNCKKLVIVKNPTQRFHDQVPQYPWFKDSIWPLWEGVKKKWKKVGPPQAEFFFRFFFFFFTKIDFFMFLVVFDRFWCVLRSVDVISEN